MENQLSYSVVGLTGQEADIIVAGLRKLPMEVAESVVSKLREQFHKQTMEFVAAQQKAAKDDQTPPAV